MNKFFTKRRVPLGCNSSFLPLIPKYNSLIVVDDFRPVSLIGIKYKIIAKILALRLAFVTDSVVGCEQSTFVKGRQIMDRHLMVNEVTP